MREGVAGDDFGDECLHPIIVLGDGFHQVIHHDLVIAFRIYFAGILAMLRGGTLISERGLAPS